MKKSVLLVNQSSGYLTTEIANAFVKSGHYEHVVLAAGNTISPLLNLDSSVRQERLPLYNKKSFITRAISWISATMRIVWLVWTKYRDYELFLISNPPTVAFAPLFFRNQYATLIYDIYPNGLVDSGLIKESNPIYRLWMRRNRSFFDRATYVYTITQGMAETLSKYCPKEKIEVVELWSNPNLPILHLDKRDNPFVQQHHLEDKFIVMYSGNMGKGHDLDKLVDVANLLKNNSAIKFVLIGDGYLKPIICSKIGNYQLNNVIVLPYQDRAMLPYSLSCPDIAVVSTNKKSGKVCIPSKTFDSMKLGRPIMSIAEHDSDIARLINKYNIGKNFSCEEIQEMAAFILDLAEHREKLLKYNAASFEAAKKHTSDLANKFIK